MTQTQWETSKKTQSGIDLLRIIAMAMVVMLHLLGQGGVLLNCKLFSVNYEMAWLIEIACYGSVNIFGIISGYVGFGSKHNILTIVRIWSVVFFYSVAIGLAMSLYFEIDVMQILKCFAPISFGVYWYFTAYFVVFLLSRWIDVIVKCLDNAKLGGCFIALIVIFSVIPTVVHNDVFGLSGGYTGWWLCLLYFIGAFARKYNLSERKKKSFWMVLYVVMTVFTWVFKYVIEKSTFLIFQSARGGGILVSYISPTILIGALSLVMFYSEVSVRGMANQLKCLRGSVFSIFLIHAHPMVMTYIIGNSLIVLCNDSTVLFTLKVLLLDFIIVIGCLGIDAIRRYLFKLCYVDIITEKIYIFATRIFGEIGKYLEG